MAGEAQLLDTKVCAVHRDGRWSSEVLNIILLQMAYTVA
jgi:hypothetical protein